MKLVQSQRECLFLFRRVVGLDRFSERVDGGFEILVGGLAALRGEVLAEARSLIAANVFAGKFSGEYGGRGCSRLGRLPGRAQGCEREVGLAESAPGCGRK